MGFEKLESSPRTISSLNRLADAATGELRNRAIVLVERKRLNLEMETVSDLFREHRSPMKFVKALGQGIFAASYVARHRETDLELLVRVLRPELAIQPHVRTAFVDSTRRAMRYVHQNLAMTRDVGSFPDQEVHFAVRDYVPGVSLRRMLDHGKVFTPEQIVRIITRVAEALRVVHAGHEAHGGVKPSNIFLTEDDRVVLGDLSPPLSILGADLRRLAYDYRYAAPEAFSLSHDLGPLADMYSLGCVFYELSCGRPPHCADNPFELASLHLKGDLPLLDDFRLPQPGKDLARGLLAPRPDERLDDLDIVIDTVGRCSSAATRPSVFDSDVQKQMDVATSLVMLRAPGDVYGTMVAPAPSAENSKAETPPPTGELAAGRLRPGQQFGKYRIEALCGAGGMGAVYRATHRILERTVALKVMRSPSSDLELRARFTREIYVHAKLTHPNVVTIYDAEEIDGMLVVAMEFVEGADFSGLVGRKGRLSVAVATELIRQAATGLGYVHQHGLVHRDVKPSNLMLARSGEVKLLDLGLARFRAEELRDAQITRTGIIVGSPAFMSPEQTSGLSPGPASDMYSLGATFFYLLSGRPPFQGSAVEVLYRHLHEPAPRVCTLREGIEPELDALIARLLAKKSEERVQSAEDLSRALAGYSSSARSEELWQLAS